MKKIWILLFFCLFLSGCFFEKDSKPDLVPPVSGMDFRENESSGGVADLALAASGSEEFEKNVSEIAGVFGLDIRQSVPIRFKWELVQDDERLVMTWLALSWSIPFSGKNDYMFPEGWKVDESQNFEYWGEQRVAYYKWNTACLLDISRQMRTDLTDDEIASIIEAGKDKQEFVFQQKHLVLHLDLSCGDLLLARKGKINFDVLKEWDTVWWLSLQSKKKTADYIEFSLKGKVQLTGTLSVSDSGIERWVVFFKPHNRWAELFIQTLSGYDYNYRLYQIEWDIPISVFDEDSRNKILANKVDPLWLSWLDAVISVIQFNHKKQFNAPLYQSITIDDYRLLENKN